MTPSLFANAAFSSARFCRPSKRTVTKVSEKKKKKTLQCFQGRPRERERQRERAPTPTTKQQQQHPDKSSKHHAAHLHSCRLLVETTQVSEQRPDHQPHNRSQRKVQSTQVRVAGDIEERAGGKRTQLDGNRGSPGVYPSATEARLRFAQSQPRRCLLLRAPDLRRSWARERTGRLKREKYELRRFTVRR